MNTLNIADQQINYRRSGNGPPVLCLHCSSSHSGQFKPLIQSLQDRFTVFAPDVHGYGGSDAFPKDGNPWFYHDLKVIEALLEQFTEPAHIVGHSLGGALGYMAAQRWPDRFKSVTLIEPVLFMLLAQANSPFIAEGHYATSMVHGHLHLKLPEEAARSFMDFWADEGAFDAAPEHVQDYVVATVSRVADDWAGMLPNLPGTPKLEAVSQLTLPTLLMRGGATRRSAAAIVELLSERLPNAQLVEMEGMTHMAAATHPGVVNPHILQFIDAQSN
ncbi:alpha/beta fold hydrolase [Actibacterium pelagium]|uniref:Alpha/beta hydrolase n=1 Tax=Actibacterium pelagium TaxID=2029103 RepID=A0A917EJ72_9RHOB|nr:alpha/beta hydrolase [Actibacterium pelagium]GGE43389.1 alpha/beta hydrolase [Actibacterium pelagium]